MRQDHGLARRTEDMHRSLEESTHPATVNAQCPSVHRSPTQGSGLSGENTDETPQSQRGPARNTTGPRTGVRRGQCDLQGATRKDTAPPVLDVGLGVSKAGPESTTPEVGVHRAWIRAHDVG